MNLALWNKLTWQEKESLEQKFDGPIVEQAVQDLLAQRRTHTKAELIALCQGEQRRVIELAAEVEQFRKAGNDKAADAWTRKLEWARSWVDFYDDEIAGME